MHRLHRLLREDERLADAVGILTEQLSDDPLIDGLIVEYNPVWVAAARLAEAGMNPDILVSGTPPGFDELVPWGFGSLGLLAGAETILGGGGGPLDVVAEYDAARWLTQALFGRRFDVHAYLLRVLLNPRAEPDADGARARVLGAARENRLPVVVETRGAARLVSAPGAPVWSGTTRGTLGGYLRDRGDGQVYAATCGHVLEAPGGALGPVSLDPSFPLSGKFFLKTPTLLPAGDRCRRGCAAVSRTDLALISATNPSANVARTVGDVDSGDRVRMKGATSTRTYQVGGACVFRKLGQACFEELWDLRPPTTGVLSPNLSAALFTPPRDGDSGSWLLRDGDVWTGMVVGADALAGYALSSDLILDEARAAFGLDLELA